MSNYRKQRIASNIPCAIITPLLSIGGIWLLYWIGFPFDFYVVLIYFFILLLEFFFLFGWWASWTELYCDLFKYDERALLEDVKAEKFEKNFLNNKNN